MITLALMLADDSNRKIFSEIAQELEKPLKEFATKLSKDMKDVTNTLAETVKGGLNFYKDDIESFIDTINDLCDVLENKGVSALNKFSRTASTSASRSISTLAFNLKGLRGNLKKVAKGASNVGFSTLGIGIEKVAGNIKKYAMEVFSLQNVYDKFISSIEHAKKIGSLADSLGLDTETFSNWTDVVKSSGGDIDQFASSVGNVQKYLNDKSISTNALDYLLNISDQMKTMSVQGAKDLGASIGIDQDTVMLLRQGTNGLQTLLEEQKKLGSITKEDTNRIKALYEIVDKLGNIFRKISLQIASIVLPILTGLLHKVKSLIDFLSEHKAFTTGFFVGIATILLGVLLPALWATFAPILAMIAVVVLLGSVLGAVFWAISALVNNLGAIFEWFGGIVSVVAESVVGAFNGLVNSISSGIAIIISLFILWFDAATNIVGAIFTFITEGAGEAINFFKNAILDGINALYDKLPNWAKKLFSGIKGIFSSDEVTKEIQAVESMNPERKALIKGADALNGAQSTSQLLASSGSKATIANHNQVSYRNDFNITSNDPKEVGRIVDEKMRAINEEAESHFNDGVLA